MAVKSFQSTSMRIALRAYRVINYLLLVPLMIYLWRRGSKDPLYRRHIAERFGFYQRTDTTASLPARSSPVWVHAVSLGELRSAVPLIKALLQQGEHIVTTHFTPVGRREAQSIFAAQINAGKVQVIYVPLELHSAFKRFYRQFTPKYGLVMEVEFWPCMIDSARCAAVPLFLCNGQYPGKSFHRDIKGLGLRAGLVSGFAGAMVKSDLQAKRFQSLGLNNVAITGELRFDQPVPQHQINAAGQFTSQLTGNPFVVTIASAVEGEDTLYIDCIKRILAERLDRPVLFIYVPRAPERFDDVEKLLCDAGVRVARRSQLFNEALELRHEPPAIDVLLGDSMGEMYFYLQLSAQVIVGGGFTPAGAHNISEAFAVSKPVAVGPTLWTIEYPATEALEAGVLSTAENEIELSRLLIDAIKGHGYTSPQAVDNFFQHHQGAINKTLTAIPALLDAHTNPTSR